MPYTYAQLDVIDLDILRNLSHIEFANRIRSIATAFAEHEGFQVPWPPTIPNPAELTAVAEHHILISNQAETGNRLFKAERDAHRPVAFQLVAMTVQWAVMRSIRESNPGLLKNLTLEPRNRTVTRSFNHPQTAAPARVKVTQGPSSTVTVRADKVPGAVTYHVAICLGDPTVEENWIETAQSTYCSQVLQGLQPGKVHHFRVRCFGPSGHGPWSAVVTLMVT